MMPADDYVEEVIHHYRPILARASDTLTCPNGHAVADAGAIDLLGSSIDRLCKLADRMAQRGYAAFDEPRVGDEAAVARLDLEAVQHAILVLRAEQRGRRAG